MTLSSYEGRYAAISSSVTNAVDAIRNLPKTNGEAPGFRTGRTVVI
jgi:hypothetical protein